MSLRTRLQNLMTPLERFAYRGGDALNIQAQANRTLIKFCRDHDYPFAPTLHELEVCLAALEAGELKNARAAFRRIPMGKEGFGDWWPPATFPGETDEYVINVFHALVERWHRLMSLRAGTV